MAETYLKLKKYDEASKEQIAILEKNPNNARARIGLGHSYLGLRRYDDSIREYKNALKQKRTPISPGWTGLLIINKYDREIKKYERRYQINTRKIEKFDIILAYDGLFDAHYEKGNYMKSLRCLFQVKGFKVKNKVANFLNSIMP